MPKNDDPQEAPTLQEIGYIHISVVMGAQGLGSGFEYEGLTTESAIGHLTAAIERLKRELHYHWEMQEAEEDMDGFEDEDEED